MPCYVLRAHLPMHGNAKDAANHLTACPTPRRELPTAEMKHVGVAQPSGHLHQCWQSVLPPGSIPRSLHPRQTSSQYNAIHK